MDIKISKAEAIAAFGGNASDLARALGVTPQAIYQWGDEVPEAAAMKLAFVLKPKDFAKHRRDAEAAARAKAA